jgi:class 3 adenylate cyclase
MLACPSCGAPLSGSPKFCPECGTRLEPPAPPSSEVRKTVTVLFSDVVGSTAVGERLDAEAVRDLMARYFAAMRRVIERHGGTVEKFIGDAIMAVFGIPTLREDDALRAVRAADEMRKTLVELNAGLEFERGVAIQARTGITTGEVVTGDAAVGGTLATGDTVNTAARLEQAAAPGEILIGAPTYRLVRDVVTVERADPVTARGKELPVPAYRLVSVTPGGEAHARRLDAPLIGRERELARLQHAYRDAVGERRCELFTLLGSAGVGKSRLVREFLAAVEGEARILRGRCLPYGEGITYWPLAEALREAASISEADDREAARGRLLTLLEGERNAEPVAARMASAIGLSDERAVQSEVFSAVRRTLEHLANERPLVVVWEDIHWAEPAFLDLIDHLAEWSRDAAILLVCPARPELLDARPSWGGGKLNVTTVMLEALPSEAAARLIDVLPGGSVLPDSVTQRIAQAAEGNPLFLEEFLGMLFDDGLLQAVDDHWQFRGEVERLKIPPSISALLAARLERLTSAERQVAQRGAVVGRAFEADAVAELAPEGLRPHVTEALMALVRKELVRPELSELTASDAFKFRHILIRDTAYEALPKRERAVLHERVADWLQRVAGDRLTEYEEIVGFHLEQAHGYRAELGLRDDRTDSLGARAAERLGAAGLRARVRQDARAALNLLARALAVLPPDAPEYPLYRLEHTRAVLYAARHDEAIAAVDELERDSRSDPMTIADAQILRVWARQGREGLNLASLRPELASILWAVRRHRPLRIRAEAWQAVGDTALDAGDVRMAGRAYARSMAVAIRSGQEEMIVDVGLAQHYSGC